MLPGAVGDQVTIPGASLSFSNGALIKDALQGGDTVTVTITARSSVKLDSSYDSGIIMHEYGHGISNRLVGGPNNVACLDRNTEEQAGEGWSDFYGLVFSPGDGTVRDRGVGTYVLAEPTDGLGIRPFPYSPDMEINPVTYDSIKTAAVPHGVGHVLNTVLWDMYWALVDEVGFDEDLYTGTGGNNIAIMLVTEALKVSPCRPSFVDYRDALLTADLTLYDGQFRCLIWNAFARRGLGVNADAGSSASRADGTEDFTTPPECLCTAITLNSQPTADLTCASEDVTLTVDASGTDLAYQWFKDGNMLQGETNASLQLTAVTEADSGSYTCTVTNACDEETTSPVALVVQEAMTFDNAGFARWRSVLGCGDVNGNNVVDVLDMVDLVPNPGIVSNP